MIISLYQSHLSRVLAASVLTLAELTTAALISLTFNGLYDEWRASGHTQIDCSSIIMDLCKGSMYSTIGIERGGTRMFLLKQYDNGSSQVTGQLHLL